MSPFTALAMLVLFKQGRINFTQAAFDDYVDSVVTLLEEVHDDQFRLQKEERDTWPADASAVPPELEATSAPVSDDDR